MEKNHSSLIVRLIPALAVIAAFIALAFMWTAPAARDGVFFYFMLLGIYATVMVFFSDVIFKLGNMPPTLRAPIVSVAVIHFIFVAVVFRLRFFLNFADTYFILATLIGASFQVAVSMVLCKKALDITVQSEAQTLEKNAKMMRDVLLMELTDSFKKASALSGNKNVAHKLELLTNSWKFSVALDTANTMQTTEEIIGAVRSLIKNISVENPVPEQILGEMDNILSLIDRRKTLLQMR